MKRESKDRLATWAPARPACGMFLHRLSCSRAQVATGVLILLVALVLGVTSTSSQTNLCINPPAAMQRIECTQDDTSSIDIDIDAEGVVIETMAAKRARHRGHACGRRGHRHHREVRKSDAQGRGHPKRPSRRRVMAPTASRQSIPASGNVDIVTEAERDHDNGYRQPRHQRGAYGRDRGRRPFTERLPIRNIGTEGQGAHGIYADTDANGRLRRRGQLAEHHHDGRNVPLTS